MSSESRPRLVCRCLGVASPRIFAAARSEGTLRSVVDPAAWRAMLRVTVNGILFSAAIAPPARAAGELRSLKAAVRQMIAVRIGEGRGQ